MDVVFVWMREPACPLTLEELKLGPFVTAWNTGASIMAIEHGCETPRQIAWKSAAGHWVVDLETREREPGDPSFVCCGPGKLLTTFAAYGSALVEVETVEGRAPPGEHSSGAYLH